MWEELLLEAGLTEREVRSLMILGSHPKMKASELAKELDSTRLDAYNSLSRLQEMGIVTVTVDRPIRFSSLNLQQAVNHIIDMKKQQLENLLESFSEITENTSFDITKNNDLGNKIGTPSFAVLKERTHI